MTLGHIYQGAYGTKNTLNLVVEVSSLKLGKVVEQFPYTKPTAADSGLDMSKTWRDNWLLINCYGAKFGDAFVYRKDNNNGILFALQYRLREKPVTINDIQVKHEKNVKAVQQVIKGAVYNDDESLSNCHLVTVFITTQKFNGDLTKIPDDCLLICKENFATYFGAFSTRAFFAMYFERNPNLLTYEILKKKYKLSEVYAKKIFENKPYYSWDELCQKVPDILKATSKSVHDRLKSTFIFPQNDVNFDILERPKKRRRME